MYESKNKEDKNLLTIKELGAKHSGIVTTRQVEEAGLYRGMLKKYVDEGVLLKESQGVYSLASEFPDEYVLLQRRSEKMIFSYGSALYLWGMSDRVPHVLHVTVPQGFNSVRIKKDNSKIKFHYVKKELWDIGVTTTQTNLDNTVRLYDKERCVCDLIMLKDEVDKQIYIQAIKEYFKGNNDSEKLLEYAKMFRIEEKVRDYMEVLT